MRVPNRQACLASVILAAAVLVCPSASVAQETERAPIVLVLFGSYTGFSPHDSFHERFVDAINHHADRDVVIRPEFFDASGEQSDTFTALVVEYLRQKYPRDRVVAVVGVGAHPIALARRVQSELYPSASLVYGLADQKRMAGYDYGANATGVTGTVDITGTVSLARQLVPDTTRIALVMGPTEVERAWYERAVADAEAGAPGVELIKILGLPKDEMLRSVATLPDRTVVVWISFFRGPQDELSVPADVISEALDVSNAPIFGVFDSDFGTGVVGGRIVDLGRAGEETGRLVARVVNGEQARTIPPIHVADNPAVVDWRAMRRWGVDPNRLPSDAVVHYRDRTVWDEYGWVIVGAVALLLIEVAIIAALLVERRRRRRASASLGASEKRRTAILRAMPDLMFLVSADGEYLDYHASSDGELYVAPEAFLGRNMRDVLPPEVARRFMNAIHLAVDSGELQTVEYTLEIDGLPRFYEARIIATDAGTALSVVRDVTEKQASDTELRRLTSRLLRLQDEEHKRVASDLHDGLGQSLAIIRNRAIICLRDPSDSDRVAEQVTEIASTAAAAMDEMREIAHNLRPFELDRLGLAGTINTMVNRIADSSQIRVVASVDLCDTRLRPEEETPIYRIVQEALNNVVRHSDATEAEVVIRRTGPDLVVAITDNGKGIDARAEPSDGKGFGLADISQRAHILGGSLAIEVPPGGGTTIVVTLPIRADREGE